MNLDKLPGSVPDSDLAKVILKEHPHGLVKCLIHGKERVGKSMFAIRVMWEVFEALGYSQDEAYDKAFNALYLYPNKFLDEIDKIRGKAKENFEAQAPVLTLDDAGIGLGGGLYDQSRDTYWKLRNHWPQMGTFTTGLFLTTPEPDDITEKFKGWSYRIKIVPYKEKGEKWGRQARIYPEDTDMLGIHRFATSKGGWKEIYSCYMPNKYYLPYHKRRVEFRQDFQEEE